MLEVIGPALIAAVGIALLTGPVSALIVWRRMAFFGDTLAHAALLGVGLSFLFDTSALLGIIAVSVGISLSLWRLESSTHITMDSLLGVLSYGTLSLGLIVIYLLEKRVALESYLFGDILLIQTHDIVAITVVLAIGLSFLYRHWGDLVLATMHPSLAQAEGVAVNRLKLAFNLLLALTVAVSMKAVGALLVSALLIIPAAAARGFARSPKMMAIIATIISCLSVTMGLLLSWFADLPSGPAMIVCASFLFTLSLFTR